MSWKNEYRSKLCTADEAVRLIKSRDRVFYGGNAATPRCLVNALAKRYRELEDVHLSHALLLGEDPLSKPEMVGHFRHNSLFVGPAERDAVNDGRADYVPVFLHNISRMLSEVFPLDVAMLMVSPPDEHGTMSFGVEVLANPTVASVSRKLIVQINENMPRVLGDCFVHVSRVDAIVEHTEPLLELEPHPIGEVERRMGEHIRGMIEDGSTLQMGIGGIPDAVFGMLDGLKDLGIHTEMLSDGAMRAIEKGIVTGRRKSMHRGKAVITFALGTRHLYDFIHNNPLIEGHPADYVNDPFVIGQNERQIAINSAIEVDITGQVCSDSIGSRVYSGFGGQVDFIRGAARSKGGKPIIALPATTKKGTVSRIVPTLKDGAGVVTSRADVHYVVTENGVASLFGRNLRERAEALIAIADPKFQDDLLRAAKERKLIC